MAHCLQESLSDGRCQAGGWDDAEGADTENYAVDEQGYCWCGDDPCPGDSCESFQAQWGSEYCGRTGELRIECEEECCAGIEECPECGLPNDECDCEEVCDFCGEPLGFCFPDCETLMEDFEE